MNTNNNRCSVLVNSCDKYEDAWFPFFELVKKYWSNCQFRFYLNTETKDYSHEGVSLCVLNSNLKNNKWGGRLLSCLNRIDTPYIILMLEDFFLQDHVDNDEILRCIQHMENDPSIACFNFTRGWGNLTESTEYPSYYEIVENSLYKVNLLAALWRKNDLISLVTPDDNPWGFESSGHMRISPDRRFYCSKIGSLGIEKGVVFPYALRRQLGYGIYRGKWLWNNDALLKKNNIKLRRKIKIKRMSRFGCFLFECRCNIKTMVYDTLKKYDKKNIILNFYQRVKNSFSKL